MFHKDIFSKGFADLYNQNYETYQCTFDPKSAEYRSFEFIASFTSSKLSSELRLFPFSGRYSVVITADVPSASSVFALTNRLKHIDLGEIYATMFN